MQTIQGMIAHVEGYNYLEQDTNSLKGYRQQNSISRCAQRNSKHVLIRTLLKRSICRLYIGVQALRAFKYCIAYAVCVCMRVWWLSGSDPQHARHVGWISQ